MHMTFNIYTLEESSGASVKEISYEKLLEQSMMLNRVEINVDWIDAQYDHDVYTMCHTLALPNDVVKTLAPLFQEKDPPSLHS